MQATIRSQATFAGVGLHGGRPVRMAIRPAPADAGIVFHRADIAGRDATIPARWNLVPEARLCTRLRNEAGVEVGTVEHVMAALAGCGIHNAVVELDGPEVPILDGSAAPFVRAILRRGILRQDAPLRAFRVGRTVRVEQGAATAELRPAEGVSMGYTIEFDEAAIGRQTRRADLANGRFVRDLCDSRTFCRARDVEAMQARGLALGGTYENAVVVDGAEVLSPGGFRHADEAVRHKMLDALGDLALAGAPILGHYEGHRAGHAVTNALLRAAFATPGALVPVTCGEADLARLPGTHIGAADLARVA